MFPNLKSKDVNISESLHNALSSVIEGDLPPFSMVTFVLLVQQSV